MIFIPLILSSLLVAAHFLRYGIVPGIIIALAVPALLLLRKRWAVRIVQGASLAAVFLWLSVLRNIILQRTAMGLSWTASAIILGGVALFTLISAALLEHPAAKKHFS